MASLRLPYWVWYALWIVGCTNGVWLVFSAVGLVVCTQLVFSNSFDLLR